MSCVSYKANYSDSKQSVVVHKEYDNIEYVIYLIGDAGNAPKNESTILLHHLKNSLENETNPSAIVWLGDNIYPVGLAPETDDSYELGKHRIEKQLECMDSYPGKIFFIPGNHDWYKYGVPGIQRQEKLIEDYLNSRPTLMEKAQNYFVPDNGCGRIHVEKLDSNLVIILMDSNWYLSDDRNQFDHCNHNSKELFIEELRQNIRAHSDKQLIVCLHHPPYTYGSHGAKFSMKDNIFPLTQISPSLWIPIPFSGLVFNNIRGRFTEQDTKHPDYKKLRAVLEEELSNSSNALVVSGHEHNLQFITVGNISYIVSGAGSKKNPVKLGRYAEFVIGEHGYVKAIKNNDGMWLEYLIVNEQFPDSKVMFRKKITRSNKK